MSRVNIQDIMYDARRKLALTHISMGIASDVASETYRENSAQWDRFVYVLSGERIFDFGEQTVFLHTGDMLLIPVGLPYRSRSAGRETCRMGVINVQLRDEESGEVVRFCDAPTLLFHDEHGVYSGLMEEIERKQNAGEPYYCLERLGNAAKLLCDFMREHSRSQYEENMRRIYNGLNYLENNLKENNSIEELAQMCALSAGSFRRLFFECKGMSPVDYRNSLRVRKAGELLASGKYTVGEVAEAVGIPDSKYFSKTYKRYTGMLPSPVRVRAREK